MLVWAPDLAAGRSVYALWPLAAGCHLIYISLLMWHHMLLWHQGAWNLSCAALIPTAVALPILGYRISCSQLELTRGHDPWSS